jgi:hypothetical protein
VVDIEIANRGRSSGRSSLFQEVMMDEKYQVVRNDGALYMECDRDTALRLVRQLNEKYEGLYSYKAVRADGR